MKKITKIIASILTYFTKFTPHVRLTKKGQDAFLRIKKGEIIAGKSVSSGASFSFSRKGINEISKEVMNKGLEVFDSKDAFIKWLYSEIVYLNAAPINCSDQDILDALGRIEHGVYS